MCIGLGQEVARGISLAEFIRSIAKRRFRIKTRCSERPPHSHPSKWKCRTERGRRQHPRVARARGTFSFRLYLSDRQADMALWRSHLGALMWIAMDVRPTLVPTYSYSHPFIYTKRCGLLPLQTTCNKYNNRMRVPSLNSLKSQVSTLKTEQDATIPTRPQPPAAPIVCGDTRPAKSVTMTRAPPFSRTWQLSI